MLSRAQKLEMINKLSNILKEIEKCENIKEVSDKTSISTSTIQRYLNDDKLILEVVGSQDVANEKRNYISNWLENAKINGVKRGGTTTQERYGFEKDKAGKFQGSRKR